MLLLVALFAASAAVASAVVFGGASSVANLETQELINYGAARKYIGSYASVGSGAGQLGFIKLKYAMAASDEPLSLARDRAAPKHFTLPQCFSGYSFIVAGSTSVRITARQAFLIYDGKITKWAQIKSSGLKGTIIPIARAEPTGSGTTEVITEWLQKNKAGIPTSQVGLGPWRTGYKGIRYYIGTGGVCTAVNIFAGAIGYAQTGIAVQVYGLSEVAVQNPAKIYVKASSSQITQALPRVLPPAAGVWSGVSLLNAPGKLSYPIASFAYLFVRQHYGAKGARVIKPWLNYLFSAAGQRLAPGFYFAPVTSSIVLKNRAAIRLIN